MAISQGELARAWRTVLDMSKVKAEETVAILTKPEAIQANVAAATQAACDIGAAVFRIEPELGGKPLRANTVAMAALKSADFVIDFLGLHLLRAFEQEDVMQAGSRILYVVEPPEALVRLLPSVEDKRRVKAAEQCIRDAGTMRIESDAGTALSVRIGEYRILSEYGYSDEPGHWDHWPAGFIATWPNEGSANGTVVIDAGDIIFPFKSYVRTPIRLEIRDGYIRDISGGFDADFLRDYMRQFDDPEAYAVSHLGWGLQPRAQWTALGLLGPQQTNGNDARAYFGNFMFSSGPNTDGGGTRDTLCHLDIPMRNCSVFLDERPMTLKGRVVADGQRLEHG